MPLIVLQTPWKSMINRKIDLFTISGTMLVGGKHIKYYIKRKEKLENLMSNNSWKIQVPIYLRVSQGGGGGVLVPLFPSKIGLCCLLPTEFSDFPAFVICLLLTTATTALLFALTFARYTLGRQVCGSILQL